MSDEKSIEKNHALEPLEGKSASRRHFSRRLFVKRSMIYGAGLTSLFASLTAKSQRASSESSQSGSIHLSAEAPVEYIVIGSGAGGGPLACNLAKAGHKVVLLEAGGDDADDVSALPFFSAFATEDDRISWDYYVRHYKDDVQQKRDTKYVPSKDGVWYPRVGSLGGCTVHSFLVEVYPSNSDWEFIMDVTGDSSWNPRNMRKYYERFERCRHVPRPEGRNPSRHGFDGWQPTEIPDYSIFANDTNIRHILQAAAAEVGPKRVLEKLFRGKLDPNDWRLIIGDREGIFNIPQLMENGRRRGPRDLIRDTVAALPNNLIVKTHTLVTRVLFEGKTAVGVEYVEGAHLYRADPNASNSPEPPRQELRVTREVIVSAGAFNSPQILKLSGIGPAEELSSHGIPVVANLPGVGENLQDRYEVGVVTELNSDFTFAQACTFGAPGDPCFADWLQGQGVYTSIGALNAIMRQSETAKSKGRPDPDLFIFSAPIRFKGYYPGYSVQDVAGFRNQFTWAVLKAHTVNRAGNVKLRSADPRDTPLITFNYFGEGSDTEGEDLASVADGVEFVRRLNQRVADITKQEVIPGPTVQTRSDILQFVMDESWGHHASCTCKIGPKNDPMAVVDSKFRVHGIKNLRVVDASVFPRIPGYFILVPIFMVSEKASDAILAEAHHRR